jgi:hypothetical protein
VRTAATTVAPTTICASEAITMMRLRGYRSATTPAGSSISRVPTRVALATMPASAADPVAASTSSG